MCAVKSQLRDSTTHQGLRLPLHYQGPNTFKWEVDDEGNRLPHSLSPRNRALDIIKSAHELQLLTWIDSGNPEVQGNQNINKFLSSIKATDRLEPADASRGDKRQTISAALLGFLGFVPVSNSLVVSATGSTCGTSATASWISLASVTSDILYISLDNKFQ